MIKKLYIEDNIKIELLNPKLKNSKMVNIINNINILIKYIVQLKRSLILFRKYYIESTKKEKINEILSLIIKIKNYSKIIVEDFENIDLPHEQLWLNTHDSSLKITFEKILNELNVSIHNLINESNDLIDKVVDFEDFVISNKLKINNEIYIKVKIIIKETIEEKYIIICYN